MAQNDGHKTVIYNQQKETEGKEKVKTGKGKTDSQFKEVITIQKVTS